MTKEGFRRYITPYIEAGKPFSAYWYTRGFGLILTGEIPTQRNEYILHVPGHAEKTYRDYGKCWNAKEKTRGAWMETIKVDGKPRTVPETTIKRWRKSVDRLRRSGFGELVTVDFDGKNTMIEGGFEL